MKDKLINLYNNKVTRSLIQLIPFGIGSGVDVFLKDIISDIQYSRLKIFFDELGKGNIEITNEVINQEEFLHMYFNTIKAVTNTHRKQKIIFFAKMLKNRKKVEYKDYDEYEYFLKILDDLSLDEIETLIRLNQYEEDHQSDRKNINSRLRDNNKFWDNFTQEISQKMRIPEQELEGFFIRMERTGCLYYHRRLPNQLSPAGGVTTERFKKLLKLINQH